MVYMMYIIGAFLLCSGVYSKDMRGQHFVVGIDEAGRGPLAGPVSVAAVAFPETLYKRRGRLLTGIRDSKRLTEHVRERWFALLLKEFKEGNIKIASSMVSHSVVDRRGIGRAIALGVARSLHKLGINPAAARVLLDGSLSAPLEWKNQETIIQGDDRVAIIAAASIIAKVRRDRRITRLAEKYPEYGFVIHKGYGTPLHYRALKKHGLSPIHRRSYCKKLLGMI